MCLITKWRFPRLSLKHKKVYKILCKRRNGYFSYVKEYKCKIGKLHKDKFIPLLSSKYTDKLLPTEDLRCINGGYFHFKTIPPELHGIFIVVAECTIPRFTLYYESISGREICAKKFIINRIL